MGQGPLSGIRIIEMEGIGPGPFSGMHLADLGADVVLIERNAGNVPLRLISRIRMTKSC
jgi:crotonobetainyl-CoA:carnitine CoA-transferase CaiB-like acyl-CoA transferase